MHTIRAFLYWLFLWLAKKFLQLSKLFVWLAMKVKPEPEPEPTVWAIEGWACELPKPVAGWACAKLDPPT